MTRSTTFARRLSGAPPSRPVRTRRLRRGQGAPALQRGRSGRGRHGRGLQRLGWSGATQPSAAAPSGPVGRSGRSAPPRVHVAIAHHWHGRAGRGGGSRLRGGLPHRSPGPGAAPRQSGLGACLLARHRGDPAERKRRVPGSRFDGHRTAVRSRCWSRRLPVGANDSFGSIQLTGDINTLAFILTPLRGNVDGCSSRSEAADRAGAGRRPS